MVAWGLEVNDFGNAILDDDKNFIKVKDEGMTEEMWAEMVAYADSKEIKGGNYKKLNLPFENKLVGQSKAIRDKMSKRVEDFIYNLLVNVFNAKDTAPLVIEEIINAGSFEPAPKAEQVEDPTEWTEEKLIEKAKSIDSDKVEEGDFDD